MIKKGIKKWPIEIAVNTLQDNLRDTADSIFDLELSISTNHIVREDLEIGVSVFYYTNKSHEFEFSTISKFKFAKPLNEEAILHYIFNCILSAITDFNAELPKYSVSPKIGQPAQYPMPEFEQLKPFILKVRNLNTPLN
jgi:hypothetical protein